MATKRLEKILSVVPQCQVLADIGCDHGYIGLGALQSGLAENVVFVDISAPSLQKARNHCPGELLHRADFICQNGIGKVRADCAVIAGMGGIEIISVLDNAECLPERLVLQPMRNQREVRQRILQDYEILTDEMFFDGKFYDLISARRSNGGLKLTARELLFGKDNVKNPSKDFVAYLKKLQTEYQQIKRQCHDACASDKYEQAMIMLKEILEEQK